MRWRPKEGRRRESHVRGSSVARCFRSADACLASPTICFIGSAQGGLSLLWPVRRWRAGRCCHAGPRCAPVVYYPAGFSAFAPNGVSEDHARSSRLRGWLSVDPTALRARTMGGVYAGVKPVGLSAMYPPISPIPGASRSEEPGTQDHGALNLSSGLAGLYPTIACVPGSRARRFRIVPGMGGGDEQS
jgi:hypothetical protein